MLGSGPPEKKRKMTDEAQKDDDKTSLTTHAKIFALSIKYCVAGLKELSAYHFKMALARSLEEPELTEVFLTDFAEAIRIAYTTTPTNVLELRHAISSALLDEGNPLLIYSKVIFAIDSIEGLASTVLLQSREKSSATRNRYCIYCERGDLPKCGGCGSFVPFHSYCAADQNMGLVCSSCRRHYRAFGQKWELVLPGHKEDGGCLRPMFRIHQTILGTEARPF